MVVQQAAEPRTGQSNRSRVVVYDPIGWELPDWSYEVERGILEPRGVELVVPKDPADADRAIVDADVVIVSGIHGQLGAAAIESLRNCVGLLCYSIGMNQVDHVAAKAAGIPGQERPVLRRRGVGSRADPAAHGRAARPAARQTRRPPATGPSRTRPPTPRSAA